MSSYAAVYFGLLLLVCRLIDPSHMSLMIQIACYVCLASLRVNV